MERPGQDVLVKYFMGNCSEDEHIAIELYLAMDIDQEYVISCMKEAAKINEQSQLQFWNADQQLLAWQKFNHYQSQFPVKAVRSFRLWKQVTVAASILLAVSAAILLMKPPAKSDNPIAKSTVAVQTDYAPGKNKAVLILSNGKKIDLNNAQNGSLAVDGQTAIQKTGNGQLVYAEQQGTQSLMTTAINTLIVPKGGQYELVLPDGTKVWMNAESSLVFPVQFTGNKREVRLKGEAYFEVAKNAEKPFMVQLNKMQVEVLGTHFNIMAYDDEPLVQTTLLEGSVKLRSSNGQQILKPGQQGLMGAGNRFVVKTANVEQAMAWKNGQFIFDDENMATISRRLARWYDISVTDLRQDKSLTYTGSISKYKYASEVLNMLEMTGTMKYKITNGKVIITQP